MKINNWSGLMAKDLDSRVNDFNSSIAFDKRLFRQDIAGSAAHAAMLGARGIIAPEEADAILRGLEAISHDFSAGLLVFPPDAEDVHMFVEAELTARIGDAGKRLHTARSRNDQVALDFRLYVLTALGEVSDATLELMDVLLSLCERHLNTVMPGYTHLQRAQPITLAHHLAAWAEMLRRDVTRLEDARARADECPLGSGALAGTTYPIDRDSVKAALGFARLSPNSLDGVADRDFALEALSCLSIVMVHLSRMAEEVVLWCSHEFGFCSLDDAYSTGSSIMPQKKNPDVAELVRGKSGRVFGSLMALLTVMKGLPLAYNKDMQEDKEAVFDAFDTVLLCLRTFAPMVETLSFHPEVMRASASLGYLNATDCADYLVKKGLPFREAYGVTGRLVRHCLTGGCALEALSLETLRQLSPLFEADVYDALSLDACVRGRAVSGGPAPEAVSAHLTALRGFMEERRR